MQARRSRAGKCSVFHAEPGRSPGAVAGIEKRAGKSADGRRCFRLRFPRRELILSRERFAGERRGEPFRFCPWGSRNFFAAVAFVGWAVIRRSRFSRTRRSIAACDERVGWCSWARRSSAIRARSKRTDVIGRQRFIFQFSRSTCSCSIRILNRIYRRFRGLGSPIARRPS